jgi:sulfite reductase beta subunit-like hemoprotein
MVRRTSFAHHRAEFIEVRTSKASESKEVKMKDKKIEIKYDHNLEEQKRPKVEVELEKGKKEVFNLEQLKSGGYIRQRQKDLFTVRLRCPGGRVPFTKLKKIAEVGSKYSKREGNTRRP